MSCQPITSKVKSFNLRIACPRALQQGLTPLKCTFGTYPSPSRGSIFPASFQRNGSMAFIQANGHIILDTHDCKIKHQNVSFTAHRSLHVHQE